MRGLAGTQGHGSGWRGFGGRWTLLWRLVALREYVTAQRDEEPDYDARQQQLHGRES
jgi:hypothetical protein